MVTQPAEQEDAALMQAIGRGDRQAFALLVRRHSNRYARLAYRLLRQEEEAEDVVQEVMLKLWEDPACWQPGRGASFTTWLYRVVTNRCLDRLRRYHPLPLAEDWEGVSGDPLPDAMLVEKRRQIVLEQALDQLPERQRLALTLCFSEGLSNREAAEMLGVKIKALESLLMRGKAGLKILLAPVLAEADGAISEGVGDDAGQRKAG